MSGNIYLIFNKEHYNCIMNGIIMTALIYFLPLLGILGLSWYHGTSYEDSEVASADDNDNNGPTSVSLIF